MVVRTLSPTCPLYSAILRHQITKMVLVISALLFANLGRAQFQSNNHIVDLQSCQDLDCINPDSGRACQVDSNLVTGIGIAPSVVFRPGQESLSLVLVDGLEVGTVSDEEQLSSQHLYVGVPSGLDVQDQPPACAVTLQYMAQTFVADDDNPDSTACGDILTDSCRSALTSQIQGFRWSGSGQGNDSLSALSRCEALAAYLDLQNRPETMCGWQPSLANWTGGALLGPDASTEVTTLQRSGCQPVEPEDFALRQVAVQWSYFGLPGSEEEFGGRSGVTPVITVVYGDEDAEESEPDVAFMCMRAYGPDGKDLPNNIQSSAVLRGPTSTTVAAALLMACVVAIITVG